MPQLICDLLISPGHDAACRRQGPSVVRRRGVAALRGRARSRWAAACGVGLDTAGLSSVGLSSAGPFSGGLSGVGREHCEAALVPSRAVACSPMLP